MYEEKPLTIDGRCHCGSVRYQIRACEELVVHECNCSICRMSGYLHLIVPEADFQLLEGANCQTEYRFNTGTARHIFCSRCGVKSYYVPRSNPDGFSVNFRCLKLPQGVRVKRESFDGQNWEDNAASLEHLA